jgi:glycosyltransferase involved in cell wall biosynthesis
MRVLHIAAGNLYGGVETLLVTLARFRKSVPSLEQEFALCFSGRLKDELVATGASVHSLGAVRVRQPISIWKARNRIRAILDERRIDVVVCHMAWPCALFGSVARTAGVPVAMWQHMASNGRHWLERWARIAGPDLVICNSQFTQREFRGAFPSTPVEVVYCPVAAPSDSYSQADREAVRAELTTPADTVVIVHTGRMQEFKGQRLLIESASRMKSNDGWTIWLVGGAQRELEQRYVDSLHRTATELGIENRVRFTGERDDVGQLLAASDIYCQPNIAPEGFGIALVEALYAGIPAVTTRIGGAIEIVNDSCGVMVPPHDSDALAAALERLIADEAGRRRLGKAGPARARELCDPSRQMALLGETLRNLGGARQSVAYDAR